MQYEQVRTTALKKRHRFMPVNISLVVAALLLAAALQQSPAARAAGGPIIHWDSHMIYAGQNNGYPWGPVGETASVQGANFPPGLQLRLVLAQGDSNSNPAICRMPVATLNTVTTAASGQFTQNFSWPVAAGQVNQQYSICALLAANGGVISHQDDGPFTVLSSSPPAINISTATVTAGSTFTVTGQNWVPPQQVNITIASCADCGVPAVTNGTAGSTGLNSGSFSVTLTIPAGARPGNYVVNALTSSGLDANHTSGARSLSINALPAVPTPTPTAAPSPTVTATTTATVTTTPTVTVTTTPTNANTSASSNSGDNGNSGLIIGLVVSTVLVLLAIAAVILFIYRQRSSKRRASQGGPARNYAQSLPPGMSSPNYGYSMPQDNFGLSPGVSSPNYNFPAQQGDSALPANDLSASPTQFMQQAGSLPGFSQPMLPHRYDQPTGATALLCMHCGSPRLPTDRRCAACGMRVGAQNPNVPY